jgi:hypothetical protein
MSDMRRRDFITLIGGAGGMAARGARSTARDEKIRHNSRVL